jgi:hypothetical protein
MGTRNAGLYTLLFGGASTVALLLGALLAVRAAFGTDLYDVGLALHLCGVVGCLCAIRRLLCLQFGGRPLEVGGVRSRDAARFMMGAAELRRPAAFGGRVQALRAVLGGVALAIGGVGLVMTARNLNELAELRGSGRLTTAQVFNKEPEVQLGNAATGLVYYSFRINGRVVTGRFRAPRADYPLLRTGRHLTVTYLPADPGIHRLGVVDGGRVLREGAGTLLLLLGGGVYFVAPVFALERALRRQQISKQIVESSGI